jgi:hypothetical protein
MYLRTKDRHSATDKEALEGPEKVADGVVAAAPLPFVNVVVDEEEEEDEDALTTLTAPPDPVTTVA